MDGVGRWVVAILATAGIVALLLFARGTPDHGVHLPAHTAAIVVDLT